MIAKCAVLIAATLACLYAADFWQSKPFADWSDKEVQKILENSPWAKLCVVTGSGQEGSSRSKHGAPSMDTLSDGGGGGRRGSPTDTGVPPTTTNLTVRWESATPIRQAIVKRKYGAEANTSAEAKRALEAPADYYIVSIDGVPRADLPGDTEDLKKQMISHAVLLIKGKDPIKAADFMTRPSGQKSEGLFAFPRTTPIAEDDKEVEFVARIGDMSVHQRFRLKDMVVNGKLDL